MDERKANKVLRDEIEKLLEAGASDMASALADIQPPSTVVRMAAKAAAGVILAYERGVFVGENTAAP